MSYPNSLQNAVVLVTGANGGLGEQFVRLSLERGASKVYASARSPKAWADPRVVPLVLDVTDPASVAAAAAASPDTTIVINNAGMTRRGEMATAARDDIRAIFETNFFGAVEVAQVYAPILKANGGGALLNVLSVMSWLGGGNAYSASKAALWAASNALRLNLDGQGTLVSSLYLGYTDTPMTAGIDAPKNDPADIVNLALDGLEAGEYEILADQLSVQVKAMLSGTIEAMYPELQAG
ncbi:MAG: SDR family oxidoreductase [Cryobacterium sp.]